LGEVEGITETQSFKKRIKKKRRLRQRKRLRESDLTHVSAFSFIMIFFS